MGLRGPKPKPLELKLLEGRSHRPVQQLDQLFRPEVGVPSMPAKLAPDARKAWRRLSVELVRYNLLSAVDRDAFEMLCRTIGRLALIERALEARQATALKNGQDPTDALMDSTPNGLRVQSALYQILNKEQGKLHRLLESFGLRPDARAKVTTAIRAQLQLFEGGAAEPAKKAADEPAGFSDFD